MDRVRNEELRRRAVIEWELASRVDQEVLRWFGHVERMDVYRLARRVFTAEVSRGRVQSKQRSGWMDGVKVALGIKAARLNFALFPCGSTGKVVASHAGDAGSNPVKAEPIYKYCAQVALRGTAL